MPGLSSLFLLPLSGVSRYKLVRYAMGKLGKSYAKADYPAPRERCHRSVILPVPEYPLRRSFFAGSSVQGIMTSNDQSYLIYLWCLFPSIPQFRFISCCRLTIRNILYPIFLAERKKQQLLMNYLNFNPKRRPS